MSSQDTGSLYGYSANAFTVPSEYERIRIPQADQNGKVPTLNQYGYMMGESDPISESFVSFSEQAKKPCLDIGAAYGSITLQALEKKATVIANDVDLRHLCVLRHLIPKKYWDRLYLKEGRFPGDLSFIEGSLSAVLLRRIIHFLSPDDIETGLKNIHSWLVDGGRVFIVVVSPYHTYFRKYLKIYEQKWREGNLWPGVINNFKNYVPDQSEYVPDYIHVMDDRPLKMALEKIGFTVEKSILFTNNTEDTTHNNCSDSPLTDGQHGVCGIIAKKWR